MQSQSSAWTGPWTLTFPTRKSAWLCTISPTPIPVADESAPTAGQHGDNAQTLIAIQEKYVLSRMLYRRFEELPGRDPDTTVLRPIPREDELLRGFTP